MTHHHSKEDYYFAIWTGTLVAVLSALIIKYFPMPLEPFQEAVRWPSWLVVFWGEASKYVVHGNLLVVALGLGLFVVLSIKNPQPNIRLGFATWSVAWGFMFVAIVLERFLEQRYFVLVDAVSTSAVLLGCFYMRHEHFSWRLLFLLIPFLASYFSPALHFWPSAFVDFFVFLFMSVTLLEHYKSRSRFGAYEIFVCLGLYAGIQLLFPFLRALSSEYVSTVRALGYTLGAGAKAGGIIGVIAMEFKGSSGSEHYVG